MVKIIRAGFMLGGLALASPHGMAECSPTQLQTAANSFFDSADPSIAAGPISTSLKSIGDSCQDDPYTQKVVALGFANLAARPNISNDQLLANASDAFAAMERMHRSMPKDNRTRPIQSRAGQTERIGFLDSYEMSKRIINLLLVAEAKAGRLAPSNTKATPGDAPIQCDVHQTGLTQEVSFWIRNNQDSPGGMNIIDKRITNCQGNSYNRASIHGHRARAMLAMLNRAPGRPDSADILQGIFADVDVLKTTRKNVRLDWGDTDQGDLMRASWAVLSTPGSKLAVPPEQWFTAKAINQDLTNMSIAAALDAAYAKDIADAGTALPTYRGYRAVVSDAYKRMQALTPNQQKTARASLYLAARMHANGTWRSEDNKDLKKPLDILYNWIDPNYKPPASAAASAKPPASAAPP